MSELTPDLLVSVKFLLAAEGDILQARAMADGHRAADRVRRILEKSMVGAGGLGDSNFGEVLADWRIASNGFFASLRTRSVFFRLLDQGFVKVPFRTNLGVVSASATGWIVGEGKAKPISRLSLSNPQIQPSKAVAILVISSEVARSMDPAAQSLVSAELKGAVADTVDEAFFNKVITTATPSFVSSGNDLAAMKRDLLALLDATNTTGGAALFWCMAPGVANGASIIDDRNAMSPLGGELAGLPAMVSSAMPEGTLRLVNAAAIAANADEIEIDIAKHASIELADDPVGSADTPTAHALASLWQAGAIALKAEISFAAERTRLDAVSEMTGISWGGDVSS